MVLKASEPTQNSCKSEMYKSNRAWYFCQTNSNSSSDNTKCPVPKDADNLFSKLIKTGGTNTQTSKNGYRYDLDLKRFAVYERILAGPLSYKTLQSNFVGLIPSISATNKYIHRPDNVITEGVLRSDELLLYLEHRNLPKWALLSEDATNIDNRIEYDSRTNQLIGFVLPTNETNGMPQAFAYKAESALQIMQYFADDAPEAAYINTIMAQPIGKAPPFCLLLFGSNNTYTADDVSKRWEYATKELDKLGIGVLTISSDGDSKFLAAIRINSRIGHNSEIFSGNNLFKFGCTDIKPPFYVQDQPHIGTKGRNVLLKTLREPSRMPFGDNQYINIDYLQQFDSIRMNIY